MGDFTDSTWGGSGVNLLKVRYCNSYDAVLILTPNTIIIPKPQNGVFFPSFRGTGMEKLCVLVPFPIPMSLATLSPNDLFTIQQIINFPSKLVNFSPLIASVINGK